MIPPEVLLDRFLRSDKLSSAERAIYKGKQDLRALEPSLASLLADVQDTLNADLRRRGNYHFDYIDAIGRNALAFEHEGYAFICVTMPLVRVLWRMSACLSKSEKVVEVLSIGRVCLESEAVLAVLFTTQFAFIVSHEFAHHDRGHFKGQGSKRDLWEEIQAEALGSLEQQAREVDADGWAVYLTLSHLITGQRRKTTCGLLGLRDAPDDLVDEILLASFIMAVATILFVFPPVEFDEKTLYQLKHPPHAARMNVIMTRVKTWCMQNRLALSRWLTLEVYQCLMRAAEEATQGLNPECDWSKQEAFFHTRGSEYFKELHELVKVLVADEGPTVIAS